MNSIADRVTVLVASTDTFEDCWEPFFTLLDRYWKCPYPVLLCTEQKLFPRANGYRPTCNVQTVHVSRPTDRDRPPWGTCVIRAVEQIHTPYVLLMLDDFFISSAVCQEMIDQALVLMDTHGVAMLTLTNHDVSRQFRPWKDSLASEVLPRSAYRVTTSPALWARQTLLDYLRPDESIWWFEQLGTLRSWLRDDLFVRINEEALPEGYREVIPYFGTPRADTAIVRGSWQREVVPFLRSEHIAMDFDVRGFSGGRFGSPGPVERRVQRAKAALNMAPKLVRHTLEVAWNRIG